MKQSKIKKAIWYAILCGVSATMPEIVAALLNAGAITEVPWFEIVDHQSITFIVAALGGAGLGTGKAAMQNRQPVTP